MEALENTDQNCDSSRSERNSVENLDFELHSLSQNPTIDEEGNADDSNDVLESDIGKSKDEGEWSEYSDEEEESEDEDVDEIDSMLEQGLPKSKRLVDKDSNNTEESSNKTESSGPNKPESSSNTESSNKSATVPKCPARPISSEPTIKKIVILEEKDENAFEVLPGDWIKVRHSSGLPLYLHRPTRVCTLAKPYYLGPASVRRHSVPLSAIPCLAYRKGLEKEQKDKELLEVQAKELENPSESPTNSQSNSSKETDDATPTITAKLTTESIAEKINSMKRKCDSQNAEACDPAKREKLDGSGDSLPEDSLLVNENHENGSGEASTNSAPVGTSTTEKSAKDKKMALKKLKKTEVPLTFNKRSNNKRGGGETSPGLKTFIPLAKVETAKENASLYSVNYMELRAYCMSLFKFSTVECKRFKTWSARRMHSKEQKRKQLERPTLPDNAQVIKFFDLSDCKGAEPDQVAKKFNDYVFNPNGKSAVCILHEFVQHALRKQPTYEFQELENAATPYAATVIINGAAYGKGLGSSKRTAKAAAAKATLEILIPQMKGQLNGNKTEPGNDFDITEYFQQVGMNDVRIAKLCSSVSEPSPYTLLLTCLQRNYGQSGSTGVQFDMIPTDLSKGNPPNQFKMSAGKETVTVVASNKREGKQLASQLLLAKLHPHIRNFGAFIKMYGNGSIKSVKEKKQEEQQITTLQSKASANSPNWAILNKLRQEMQKLAEQEQADKEEPIEHLEVIKSPPAASNGERSPTMSIISDVSENIALNPTDALDTL